MVRSDGHGHGHPKAAPAVVVTQPDYLSGGTAPCLMHQTEQPHTAYEGGPDAQPTFLAYYTAASRKPFCDGRPATPTDTAWPSCTPG